MQVYNYLNYLYYTPNPYFALTSKMFTIGKVNNNSIRILIIVYEQIVPCDKIISVMDWYITDLEELILNMK